MPRNRLLSDIMQPGECIRFGIGQYKCVALRSTVPDDKVNTTVTVNGVFLDRFDCPVSATESELRILTSRKIYGESHD